MKKLISFISMLIVCILVSYSYAKYYSVDSQVVWKTQFASYTVSDNKDVNTFIVGKTSDNENALVDGDASFDTTENGGPTSNRWTNWYDGGIEGRGMEVELHLKFAELSTISILRLYHFVDASGVDLPTSVSISYINDKNEVVLLIDAPLTSLIRNFDVASDRTSIFRTYGSHGLPKYSFNGVDYEFAYGKQVIAPYTEIDFGEEITTSTIIIKMQANDNWYLGLKEIAMDWKFVESGKTSLWYSTFHPAV